MANLVAFFLSLVGPLITRIVLAFGISIISYKGIDIAFQSLIDYFIANWSALPSDILIFATLLGLPTSLSMLLGVISARVAIFALTSASKLVFK